ncbi:hypothetical protein GMRT_15865 [Giardia muris]|uniref:CPL domain-containing protein n=1 Tax=Giardia muris TaxID=5742 RepID=A0A4Z1T764_GIAMU|nr:hypothetical protein GMRT_15865 [Giardia muris]|eukprot:TNJ29913.1 hypothetical protein GMRT_15865 [Giardia muris]
MKEGTGGKNLPNRPRPKLHAKRQSPSRPRPTQGRLKQQDQKNPKTKGRRAMKGITVASKAPMPQKNRLKGPRKPAEEFSRATLLQTWEAMRPKKVPLPNRQRYIEQLLPYLLSNMPAHARKNVETRILCFAIRHGSPEQRKLILKSIMGHVVELSMNKYGMHLIKAIGGASESMPAEFSMIIQELLPNTRTLCTNSISATTLSSIFQDVPLKRQNAMLMAALGPCATVADLSLVARERNVVAYVARIPGRYDTVLTSATELILQAGKKDLLGCTLLSRLAADTLELIFSPLPVVTLTGTPDTGHTVNGVTPKTMEFMMDLVDLVLDGEGLLSLVDTADGVRLACFLMQLATPKQRKTIVKLFKGHTRDLAVDDIGFVALCQVFAVTDDTVLTTQAFVNGPEGLGENLGVILRSLSGLRLIYFLLYGLEEVDNSKDGTCPLYSGWICKVLRSTSLHHLLPEATLDQFKGLCKKPSKTKQGELRAAILPSLLEVLCDESLLQSLLTSSEFGSQFIVRVLSSPEGANSESSRPILEALARAAVSFVSTSIQEIRNSNKELVYKGRTAELHRRFRRLQKQKKTEAPKAGEPCEDATGASPADTSSDENFEDFSTSESESEEMDVEPSRKNTCTVSKKSTASEEKPVEQEPLFRQNIGYYSIRRVINNCASFAALLLKELQNHPEVHKYLAERRGAFVLEHIVAAMPDLAVDIRDFVKGIGLFEVIQDSADPGCKALRARL